MVWTGLVAVTAWKDPEVEVVLDGSTTTAPEYRSPENGVTNGSENAIVILRASCRRLLHQTKPRTNRRSKLTPTLTPTAIAVFWL